MLVFHWRGTKGLSSNSPLMANRNAFRFQTNVHRNLSIKGFHHHLRGFQLFMALFCPQKLHFCQKQIEINSLIHASKNGHMLASIYYIYFSAFETVISTYLSNTTNWFSSYGLISLTYSIRISQYIPNNRMKHLDQPSLHPWDKKDS